uniref:Uncharacterized protein n=1 Tax=Amphimedon queenslandica TaxID=400682 RepID=A0A1X7VSP3_AMPQE
MDDKRDPAAVVADTTPVTQAQFKQIIDTLKKLEKEITTSSKETAESVARRIKREKNGYEFKKKAAKIEETEGDLKKLPVIEATKQTLDNAKDLLQQGLLSLAKRQKHFKMADCSEQGWAVVQEYPADALADDSDDEKKIEKAEKASKRKAA